MNEVAEQYLLEIDYWVQHWAQSMDYWNLCISFLWRTVPHKICHL